MEHSIAAYPFYKRTVQLVGGLEHYSLHFI